MGLAGDPFCVPGFFPLGRFKPVDLADGVIAVVGFLPLVMIMYFLIAILEDCGYMSRVAVVLDPIFKRVGLSGKSVIPFVICLALVLGYEIIGITQTTALVIAFLITACWWICCSVPLVKHYRQTAYVERRAHPIRDAFGELGKTLKHAKENPNILFYLLAFFFFINGVYTIIDMATAYGTSLGLDTTGLLLALLVTQIVAFPFAILFGRLASKVSAGKLMKICIISYSVIILFAVFLVAQWQFWLLAVLVGMFQGGIQALSRSYLTRIIPAERSAAYFGLMDICGKGASFLGMLLVGVVNQALTGVTLNVFGLELQNANIAVSALLILMVIGFVLFCKADKLNQK